MSRSIEDLQRIMGQLRDPESGCPWDIQQTFETIAPYTIEEAYEVADAIDRRDDADLRDELGDLLLQVVFHAQIASEAKKFDLADVVESICAKMIRRHPHVFPDASGNVEKAQNAVLQTSHWEAQKHSERFAKGDTDLSALAGVARGIPEWQRALKLQKRASRVGFDWSKAAPVLDKLHEEIEELRHELEAREAAGSEAAQAALDARIVDEVGDVLFVCVNLARLAGVDYSQALRSANAKFERRFRHMEHLSAQDGSELKGKSLAEQDAYWERAKVEDKAGRL